MPFNIIYSSGTTGTPKGIVQPHGMRWTHVMRGGRFGYGPDTVTLLATPLYSNTTLVVFFPTLAFGGTVVLMAKFDVDRYLALAARHRVTHTMLVPVQYQRLMASPRFGDARPVVVPHQVLHQRAVRGGAQGRRPRALAGRPGRVLRHDRRRRHLHPRRARAPDKLHTVGQPAEGHDIRLIDEAGRELPRGAIGEVVGHSAGMMTATTASPRRPPRPSGSTPPASASSAPATSAGSTTTAS